VIERVQHVSLDLKLPADMGEVLELGPGDFESSPRNKAEWTAARRACLELIAERNACAKLVVAGGREHGAFEDLLWDLARIAPRVPLYIQPATAIGGVSAPTLDSIHALVEDALELGLRTRVMPQMHRFLGVP
jgi:7-carboxy-7-deazaguanine synthase